MVCACSARREAFDNDTAAAVTPIRDVGIDVEAMVSAPAECLPVRSRVSASALSLILIDSGDIFWRRRSD